MQESDPIPLLGDEDFYIQRSLRDGEQSKASMSMKWMWRKHPFLSVYLVFTILAFCNVGVFVLSYEGLAWLWELICNL